MSKLGMNRRGFLAGLAGLAATLGIIRPRAVKAEKTASQPELIPVTISIEGDKVYANGVEIERATVIAPNQFTVFPCSLPEA